MEKFVIVDGNSLINRAFYGLPPLRSLDGRPCGAVYGFINMILNVITKERPKYFVCVFDAGKHTFRNDLYQGYKAKRDKMPEDLAAQLPILKELLAAMKIKILEKSEIEADDIIGSLTRKFEAEFILLSSDRDLLQLIDETTTVWLTKKGVNDVDKVGLPELKDQFGIEPYQVIELKSIQGDTSDNIPGVKGIGKVGAERLIGQYGSLDSVYAHIDEIEPKLKTKLTEQKDMAYLSHTLATIKLDVDLDVSLAECELRLPFSSEVYALMKSLDFKSIISKKNYFEPIKEADLTASFSTPSVSKAEEKPIQPVVQKVDLIEIVDSEGLRSFFDALGTAVAFDMDDLYLYFAFDGQQFSLYRAGTLFLDNIAKFRQLFEGEKEKICFDAKALMHQLDNYGISLNHYFDVSIAIYIANELDAEISLQDALTLNKIETNSTTFSLFKLKEIYLTKLINSLQLKLYSQIELPLVEVLFDMERTGIKIDEKQIKILSQNYHLELEELTKKIYELAGTEFNINSPKQLQDVLFNQLKIPYKGKKGTGIDVLNAISGEHEVVGYIIRYRKIAKLISTYLDGMQSFITAEGKIHTTFMQRTTATGRISSREPNMQNLPIRDDEGRALRKMFSSSFEGGSIISADYSQIELRLIANFSEDENMIADFLSGKDIHTATASKIFNVREEDVDKKMRRVAKSVNFGIIYGISGYGLSQSINSTPKEASEFIRRYMNIYPKVKLYGEKCIQTARDTGYASTIMGRTRHITDINSGNHVMRAFAERTAKNMPLQGSASDIIKLAMIRVYQRLKEQHLNSKLVLQIHDELVVDCYKGESEQVKKILKEEMESIVDLRVPLLTNISEGATLFDAK